MRPGAKRAKTGCITCRIRRVKCGEERPNCLRCTSTGRKCDGYSDLPFSRRDLYAASQGSAHFVDSHDTGPLLRLVTDPAFSDILEKRYFQFFRLRTVESTNSLVAAHFWDRTVLQTCHTVPAVKHAVLALSSWHQWANCKAHRQHRDYADRQYQLALQHARTLVATSGSEEIDKILTACIVFICFEGVRGNYKASQLHMDNGRAIARQHVDRFRNQSRRKDLVEIQDALARLDIPAVCFSDMSSPYRYTVEDLLDTDPSLTPWEFKDVLEARTSLVDLSRWMLVIGHYIDTASDETAAKYDAQKRTCYERLHQWHSNFDKIIGNAEPSTELLILNLQQWYHACLAVSIGATCGPETKWDAAFPHFEKVVEFSEEIVQRLIVTNSEVSFSYDVGYIIATFLAATVCRDPSVRRRAIAVLFAIPRQEGVWASRPAGVIAQRWMQIEEEGLDDVKTMADVPDRKRIRGVDLAVDALQETADVTYTLPDPNGDGRISISERLVWTSESGGLHGGI